MSGDLAARLVPAFVDAGLDRPVNGFQTAANGCAEPIRESQTMEPDLQTLRAAVVAFGGAGDRSWAALAEATAPALNPLRPVHRRALRIWLNAWGCRLRYPRAGEPDPFDLGLARWWRWRGAALVGSDGRLARLTDEQIGYAAECYADLAALPIALGNGARSLGPTAASKLLYALRPAALMPWDAAIAKHLHGARDSAAYARHLRLGRDWALRILAEGGGDEAKDEAALADALGQPGRTLAKMLDDYCYLEITRERRPA